VVIPHRRRSNLGHDRQHCPRTHAIPGAGNPAGTKAFFRGRPLPSSSSAGLSSRCGHLPSTAASTLWLQERRPGRSSPCSAASSSALASRPGRSMSTRPAVAKTVWTGADFDRDGLARQCRARCRRRARATPSRPPPAGPGLYPPGGPSRSVGATLSFWICPATLVFGQASDLTTDINLQGWSFQLSLDAIQRSRPDERGYFEWTSQFQPFPSCALADQTLRAAVQQPGGAQR